ncbi:helix-turn-helix domain-containing protein [Nocardioides sp. MH1]|uniref:helix-turn-helix domain-containing protein n=1 Tax=Nocardioides sp. MH1 TaxID=3242490 RepID=UPI0035201F70
METQTATPPETTRTDPQPRTELPRGSTLAELEAAGVAVVPVHHETKANAADVLGVGRSLIYAMAADGRLPVLRLGKRKVVSVARLRALIDGAV